MLRKSHRAKNWFSSDQTMGLRTLDHNLVMTWLFLTNLKVRLISFFHKSNSNCSFEKKENTNATIYDTLRYGSMISHQIEIIVT